jgi:hypothetical protein
MRRIATRLLAATLFGSLGAAGALAQDRERYPRIVGSGENASVEYGPGPHGNIVGGGPVVVTGSGETLEVRHLDPLTTQHGYAGYIPSSRGSGEDTEVVWLPAMPGGTMQASASGIAQR